MLNRIKAEPVLVTTLLGALLTVLVQAGLPISDGLANAITALVVAVLAIVARGKVTPVDGPPDEAGEVGLVQALVLVVLVLVVLVLIGHPVHVG